MQSIKLMKKNERDRKVDGEKSFSRLVYYSFDSNSNKTKLKEECPTFIGVLVSLNESHMLQELLF